MARDPIRFKAMIRDAYGARWIGPFSSRAAVNERVREEMSPDREGPRGAVVYRYDSDVPLAQYELVPRMVLRSKVGSAAWKEKVVTSRVENPARKRKARR